jgi:hypothetical protein
VHNAAIDLRPRPTTQFLRSGRLAGVEWRDLVALTPIETARERTLCLPWLALSLALAGARLYLPALAASFMMSSRACGRSTTAIITPSGLAGAPTSGSCSP